MWSILKKWTGGAASGRNGHVRFAHRYSWLIFKNRLVAPPSAGMDILDLRKGTAHGQFYIFGLVAPP
jgi:hypothetical protein